MDGKLLKFFIPHEKFNKYFDALTEDEPINFEDLYAVLC